MSTVADAAVGASKSMAVFIDADNLNDATALDHVLTTLRSMADRVLYRRAYGRPQSLQGIEAVLWRHGVRPVANLIVDKVTTDSALVIDAVEAICTNKIDTVAICSGDADFVPLAIWLREKGCRVLCYSLAGKIFANPESFYDNVVLLNVVEANPIDVGGALDQADEASLSDVVVSGVLRSEEKKSATSDSGGLTQTASKPKKSAASPAGLVEPSLKAILATLPELRTNEPMHLSVATKRLRDSGLLGSRASSTGLFGHFAAQFELTPPKQPNKVRYRG